MLRFALIWLVLLSGCRPNDVIVWIAMDGALTVDGRPATKAELGTLRSVKAASSACLIAEGSVPHTRVIEVMEALNSAGVKDLRMGLAPGPCAPR